MRHSRSRRAGTAGHPSVPRCTGGPRGSRTGARRHDAVTRGDLSTCARLVHARVLRGPVPRTRTTTSRATGSTRPSVLDAWVAERDGEIVGHVAISQVGLDTPPELRWREITGASVPT